MARNVDTNTVFIPCKSDEYTDKMTNLKTVFFSVENKPFRIYTSFFIGDRKKLEKELKRKENVEIGKIKLENEKSFSGLTFPCTSEDGHSFVMIWMPSFKWTMEDFETLSHECLHATIMVMKMSGVKAKIFSAEDDECDDEGICYGQSSMFVAILSELVKRQNKEFKKTISVD